MYVDQVVITASLVKLLILQEIASYINVPAVKNISDVNFLKKTAATKSKARLRCKNLRRGL